MPAQHRRALRLAGSDPSGVSNKLGVGFVHEGALLVSPKVIGRAY
jgi:hypothetical protein